MQCMCVFVCVKSEKTATLLHKKEPFCTGCVSVRVREITKTKYHFYVMLLFRICNEVCLFTLLNFY